MSYRVNYDSKLDPPAPVLDISFGNPKDTSKTIDVKCVLVDSGADLVTIPEWIADQLKLMPTGWANSYGFDGTFSGKQPVYSVIISFDKFSYIERAVQTPGEPLIGRNILNKFNTNLRGPLKRMEVTK